MNLLQSLFDINIKINDKYISSDDVYKNILLKLNKRIIDSTIPEYKIFKSNFNKIKCENDKYKLKDILHFMNNFLFLPIHYTYLKELNLINNNFNYIKKKYEYQAGYYIYKEFKLNNNNYNIYYQYQIYKYKIDYVINPKNTNILVGIEIDEKWHIGLDETERYNCIELSGIPLIHIKVDKLKDYTKITPEFMESYILIIKNKLNDEINKQQLFNESLLFEEAKLHLIEEDFAKITGLSIINNEDFIIPGDYVIKYLNYNNKIGKFIQENVTNKLIENKDFIILSKNDYISKFINHKYYNLVYKLHHNDRRKIIYLFNTNGMNLAIMNVNSDKATEVKRKLIIMYQITKKLLCNKILCEQKNQYDQISKIKYLIETLQTYKYNNKIQYENKLLKEEINILKTSNTKLLLDENEKLKNEIKFLKEEIKISKEPILVTDNNDSFELIKTNIKNDFLQNTGFEILYDNKCIIPTEIIVKYINYCRDYSFIKYNVTNKLEENKDYIKLTKKEYINYIENEPVNKDQYKIALADTREFYYLFNLKGLLSTIISSRTKKAIEIKNKLMGTTFVETLTCNILNNNKDDINTKYNNLQEKYVQLSNENKELKLLVLNNENDTIINTNYDILNNNLIKVFNNYSPILKSEFIKNNISIKLYDILELLYNNSNIKNTSHVLHHNDVILLLESKCPSGFLRTYRKINFTNEYTLFFDTNIQFVKHIKKYDILKNLYSDMEKKYETISQKKHILFNSNGFYKICHIVNTEKAKQVQKWFNQINNILVDIIKDN